MEATNKWHFFVGRPDRIKGKKKKTKKVEIQENELILLADGFSQTTESKCLETEGDLRNA